MGGLRRITVVLVLALGACGGAGMVSYSPDQETTKFDEDQLFGATQRAIEQTGYQPIRPDREGHAIQTREKEVGYSNVPRLSYRYSFRIETKGGVLKIDAACEQNTSMNRTEFSDCGDERPQHVVDEQDRLKAKILEIAKGLP
jgi:hypothetical protein